jgi:hypothetical protein
MNLPPHFIDTKTKELSFTSKVVSRDNGNSYLDEIFPDHYTGVSCSCEETFYKLREKFNA